MSSLNVKTALLSLSAAFLASLQAEADDKTTIANSATQIANLKNLVPDFTPEEEAQIDNALAHATAAEPPLTGDVADASDAIAAATPVAAPASETPAAPAADAQPAAPAAQ